MHLHLSGDFSGPLFFVNKSLERRPGKIQIISKRRMALIVVCYVLNFGGLLSRDLLTKKHGTRKVWT